MSTQPPNDRLSRKPGFRATRAAILVCATLAISASSLWAKLPSPAQAAAAASGTISALFTTSGTNFAANAATAIDSLAKADLSVPDISAIVKAALGTISDKAALSGTAVSSGTSILVADEAIGAALAADTTLEGITKTGLIDSLEAGITGISGVKGKSQIESPQAAEYFVQGLLSSGTVPDSAQGVTATTFAEDILKRISKNANVAELVAYQVGFSLNLNSAGLVTLSTGLFTKFPKDAGKVAQGVLAVVPEGVGNETAREAFITSLTTAQLKQAPAIAEGAAFVDPSYAGQFTDTVFAALRAAPNGSKLSIADAGKIATDIGIALGQDVGDLTKVANEFSMLTGSNLLPVASTATYVRDLLNGAVKSKSLTSQNAAHLSKFAAAAGSVSTTTAADLATILDLFADGIVKQVGTSTPADIKKLAADIGNLAKTIARLTGNDTTTVTITVNGTPTTVTEPVAVYLAGTLGDYIASLNLGTAQATIFNAIVKGVQAVTNKTIDAQVAAVFSTTSPTYTEYTPLGVGNLTPPETTVTNM